MRKLVSKAIWVALACAVVATAGYVAFGTLRFGVRDHIGATEARMLTVVGPQLTAGVAQRGDDAAFRDATALQTLSMKSDPAPDGAGFIDDLCGILAPAISFGGPVPYSLWGNLSQRLVPIPLVGARGPGAPPEGVSDQALLFFIATQVTPSDVVEACVWRGGVRASDDAPLLEAVRVSIDGGALSDSDRRGREFFSTARDLWIAARDRDRQAFDTARQSFKASDRFVAACDGRPLVLSGAQLDAMAALLGAGDFTVETPEQ